MQPKSASVFVALFISIVAVVLSRTGHPLSNELKEFLSTTTSQIVDSVITIGPIIYAAYHHYRAVKDPSINANPPGSQTGDPKLGMIPPPADSSGNKSSGKLVSILWILVGFAIIMQLMGCQANPQQTAIREGMVAVAAPIFNEYDSLLGVLTAPTTMPATEAHSHHWFTAKDVAERRAAIAEFNALEKLAKMEDARHE